MGQLIQGIDCIAAQEKSNLHDDFIDLANRLITEADKILNDDGDIEEAEAEGTEKGKYRLGAYVEDFREISIQIYNYLKQLYPTLGNHMKEYGDTEISARKDWISDQDKETKLQALFMEIKYLFTTESFKEILNETKLAEENRAVKRAIELFGNEVFRNTSDINNFFQKHTNYDNFPTWFNTEIGEKEFWGKGKLVYKYRKGMFMVRETDRFTEVWNQIINYIEPTNNSGLNLFQFFSIFSPMMNETGGRFKIRFQTTTKTGDTITDAGEKGLLDYMFRYNYQRERLNRRADKLFQDTDFINAHQKDKPEDEKNVGSYDTIEQMKTNGTLEQWSKKGKANYPAGFETNPMADLYVAQADFYKFRGRGLIQTTHRSAYRRLVNAIRSYTTSNTIIQRHKTDWDTWVQTMPVNTEEQRKAIVDLILTKSKNAHWSELFADTNYIIPGLAIKSFDSGYLNIQMTAESVGKQDTRCCRRGSFYFVGSTIGGSEDYGRVLRGRIIQMIKQLVKDADNKQHP